MRKTFAKILGIMISCVLISQTMTVYAVTTQKDLKNLICPRCHAPLVLKQGPYGEFYGCSQYPKCHFKMNKK